MLDEVAETIAGCVEVLRNVDEDNHDPRLWAVMSALKMCVERLDDANETES